MAQLRAHESLTRLEASSLLAYQTLSDCGQTTVMAQSTGLLQALIVELCRFSLSPSTMPWFSGVIIGKLHSDWNTISMYMYVTQVD
jgi:hypothetical protein